MPILKNISYDLKLRNEPILDSLYNFYRHENRVGWYCQIRNIELDGQAAASSSVLLTGKLLNRQFVRNSDKKNCENKAKEKTPDLTSSRKQRLKGKGTSNLRSLFEKKNNNTQSIQKIGMSKAKWK